MRTSKLNISTTGEGFYDFTQQLKDEVTKLGLTNGVLTIFNTHTSCGLTISESYDPSAKTDMEKFLKHLAPRNLAFIEHTAEGEDDSPSHMKSILLETSLNLIIEDSRPLLGTWQGLYLAEFRDSPKTRTMLLKFQED